MEIKFKAKAVKRLAEKAKVYWAAEFEKDREDTIVSITKRKWPVWFTNRYYTRQEAELAFAASGFGDSPVSQMGQWNGVFLRSHDRLELASRLANLDAPDTAEITLTEKEWNTLKVANVVNLPPTA